MPGKRTRKGSGRVTALALAAALVLAGGWLGATADPAGAVVPGKNGRVPHRGRRLVVPFSLRSGSASGARGTGIVERPLRGADR